MRNPRRDLYDCVEKLQRGGGHVRVAMGTHHPDRHVFDLELPAAGDGAWEPLFWRTIRSAAYRLFLDQDMAYSGSELRTVSIRIDFTPPREVLE